ncbi:M14 family metallopeptidase [Paenibacillus crassostreae]|uniref:Peptidase M14 n=1 Tax=Paenibacillus crassostreae TaxID=1763538 RepID=A0A167FYB1_9BACL|nr:M14 family metallocarboxypeptidase [Paenibacillus crassostreae]AOZ93949.1 peptidase M14 [Paenibacillus crassostreae]OAB77019.1 peptidase M14 [Paenibacillus crassostreae]
MQQYIVRKGDTLHRIAANKGLMIENIVFANPWSADQSYLIPGQVLFLPSSPRRRYEIQLGDSLEIVAEQFSIQTQALEDMNPGISQSVFPVGRILVLPSSEANCIVEPQGEYGYNELMQDIEELLMKYSFIKTQEIGKSVMGKSLSMLRIGKGPRQIHVNASIHANEWITTLSLMKFVEQYAEAYHSKELWNGYDPQTWFKDCTLWLLPMANPDGVELVQEGVTHDHVYAEQLLVYNNQRKDFKHWKANIRGVDLGDQFPAHWIEEGKRRGIISPSPRDYGGTHPLSEPEAQALATFTLEIPLDYVISLHSQGQEIYWNYRDYEPEESQMISQRLAQVSGYRSVKLQGSDAGYKDWFIQHFKRPGFTVEVGQGVNPLPIHHFRNISFEVGMILGELMN